MTSKFFIFIGLGLFFVSRLDAQVKYLPEDTVIFHRFLQYAQQGDKSIGRTAQFFMNTPYVGGTLEGDEKEALRINLRELDCVTFVENVLSLHLLLQSDEHSFQNFCCILQHIRYRNGIVDGYLSRLHYFSEWLDNNRQMGMINLPAIPVCREFTTKVSFMSTNCNSYPALKSNTELCKQMAAIEKSIHDMKLCYIPKEQMKVAEASLKTGDIIAITTLINSLDISHTGIAIVQNGSVYLLHASSEAKKVILSDETLFDYLANRKNNSGVMVARINQ